MPLEQRHLLYVYRIRNKLNYSPAVSSFLKFHWKLIKQMNFGGKKLILLEENCLFITFAKQKSTGLS